MAFLRLQLHVACHLRKLRRGDRHRRGIFFRGPQGPAQALQDQITVLSVGRGIFCQHIVVPEIVLQRDQLLLIGHIPVDAADDDFILAVAIETAEIHTVQIDYRHVVAALGLIIDRHNLLAVVLPFVPGVIVRGFDF